MSECSITAYFGMRETIPAVMELNVSLKRGFVVPRYQAMASSSNCKTRKSWIAYDENESDASLTVFDYLDHVVRYVVEPLEVGLGWQE